MGTRDGQVCEMQILLQEAPCSQGETPVRDVSNAETVPNVQCNEDKARKSKILFEKGNIRI